MGWFRQGGNASQASPAYTGLQLQTATNTLPIPLLWGANKLSVDIIWYANFRQRQSGGGGKGKGIFSQPSPGQIYYTADIIMALCEGPIQGIGIIWRGQSIYTLAELALTLFEGTTPQAVWSYLAANYPSQALAYAGTAYVASANYNLGADAIISNHNLEVFGQRYQTGFNDWDADPAEIISDFLTSPQYGVGFPSDLIDLTTLFGSTGDASLQTYCFAQGIALSPCIISQEQASSILTRILQLCNTAAFVSGGLLKFVPYGDEPITAGTVTTRTVQVAIPTPVQNSSGSFPPATIMVSASADFVSDGGVVFAFNGVPFSFVGGTTPGADEYGISGGTYYFNEANSTDTIAITFTYNLPYGYTPNLTPVYSLNDSNYIFPGKNSDPIQVSELDPYTLPNIQRIEISDRNNQYVLTPVEAHDQSQIEIYGPRVGPTITAHEITDPYQVAPIVAQVLLQRGLYVRKNYHFKLGPEFALLDPMDIIEVTDVGIGLVETPVRIISIEEDDSSILSLVCEELVVGVSTPDLYQTQPNGGGSGNVNRTVVPGPVNPPPLIYEVPATIIGSGSPALWLGASGGDGTTSDPNWGGANVYVSLDDTTYTFLTTIGSSMVQGVLTAPLANASGYDTTNTLSVNLAESGGILSSVGMQAAQQGVSLSLVDNELLAYATATLTSPFNYDLTGLARGSYGSTPASHLMGANFFSLNPLQVLEVPLPANYIGVPLYFKFPSLNIFGSTPEDLSTVAVYTYTPTGAGSAHPIIAQLSTGQPVNLQTLPASTISVSDNLGVVSGSVTGALNLGSF